MGFCRICSYSLQTISLIGVDVSVCMLNWMHVLKEVILMVFILVESQTAKHCLLFLQTFIVLVGATIVRGSS